ncbi:HNH endonuclease [Methylobacter svalbardensis]|uniref:HNH endonuclease n=1 Tax=Methylobacter svalbardensis TaxID=3080016 RepID=UPI0030EC9F86
MCALIDGYDSAQHRAQVAICLTEAKWLLEITSTVSRLLPSELVRSFGSLTLQNGKFVVPTIDILAILLRRAAKLAQVLPNQAANDFELQVQKELSKFPTDTFKGTEVERMVRQRIGQNVFRNAMLNYWGGSCAVTSIAVSEVLKASHAKPWVDCTNDTERLDVFNGFLLSANLDALFDRCLITFDDDGKIIISTRLSQDQCDTLGLSPDLCLRWIANEHLLYLQYHRSLFL